MELRRFYVTPEDIDGDVVTIRGNEYRHMTSVLRFKVGYLAIVCDNSGYDRYCTVTAIDKSTATLRVDSVIRNEAELPFPLTLCCGLIKDERMEIAVQKAVEIGVTAIQPFHSLHTSEQSVRLDRLERIALEACKQCGRAILPTVYAPIPFEQLFETDRRYYMAYEREHNRLLRDVLSQPDGREIGLIVGSEGGFTDKEAAFAEEQGATLFSLGKRILRAETASIVALGTICAFTEEI